MFGERVLPGIRALVPCEVVGYNDIHLQQRRLLGIYDPSDYLVHGLEQRFLALAHQHPLVVRQHSGDLRAATISQHLPARQFHATELYQDFYKLFGFEDQLAFGLRGDSLVAIALNRLRRTFTERDRQVLELLRPHLAQAYLHITEREQALAIIAALEANLEHHHAGLIGLDRQSRIAHISDTARELLAAYLPADPLTGSRLPAILHAWVGGRSQEDELVITGARGQLRVRRHTIEGAPPWRALVLTEERQAPPDLAALIALGLTRREAEILQLLTGAKSNLQIAEQLDVSPATVRKHLEHIYAKLGVSSRSQAIARALR